MKKSTLTYLGLFFLSMMILSATSCKKDEEDPPNTAPTIASVVVAPTSVNANGIATVTTTASDANGDALTYSYTVSGGSIVGNGASASWTAASQEGAYSVTVTVSDGLGGQASANGALTVLAATTQVTGTAKFPVGTSGDLSNSKVSLYTSYDNWNNNQPIKFGAVTGSGASVSFSLTDVVPGNYYLDIWKDQDNNGMWTSNDFIGWYGSGGLGSPSLTQFQLAEGQTFNCTVEMYIIAKKDAFPKELKYLK